MERRRLFAIFGLAAAIGAPTLTSASARPGGHRAATNLGLFRQIVDRGFNAGDLTVADEICSPRLIEHEYMVPPNLRGAEILKFQIQAARAEMQGLHLTIEDHVDDGSKLWVRMRGTGTEPRSRRAVTIDIVDICRFEGGRLVEHWGVPDRFALLHQSGALPPRGPS